MRAEQIDETMNRYMSAFNAGDLDAVMSFFAEDAVYEPGDGKTHRGKRQIRAAFAPQFAGALGGMRFDEYDRLIDTAGGKVAIRWICHHDLAQFRAHGLGYAVQKIAVNLVYGRTFSWHGVDLFHLDPAGLISEKYTYSWFGSRPYLERETQQRSERSLA